MTISTASSLVMPRERRNPLAGTHMPRIIILLASGLLLAFAGLSYLLRLDGLALLLLISSAAIVLQLFDNGDEDDSGWRPL